MTPACGSGFIICCCPKLRAADGLDGSRACVDSACLRAVGAGGGKTGPNPTDPPQAPGVKHHGITDANGVPLAAIVTGANRPDVTQWLPWVAAGACGSEANAVVRCRRPQRLYADRAYDSRAHRKALRARHISGR